MTDDRTKQAFAHLQTAALELIKAARAVLDVAEEVVKDPGDLADFVTDVAAKARPGAWAPGDAPGGSDTAGERVTRIPVEDEGPDQDEP